MSSGIWCIYFLPLGGEVHNSIWIMMAIATTMIKYTILHIKHTYNRVDLLKFLIILGLFIIIVGFQKKTP